MKELALFFNFICRYIHGVLSLNNSKFVDHVECLSATELETKDTTDTDN